MFSTEVKATLCPHGIYCLMWGCCRKHPDGRIVGYDCIHNNKCNDINCENHHSTEYKNSTSQKERIIEAGKLGYLQRPDKYWHRPDYDPKKHRVCLNWVCGNCKYGDDKCFYAHKLIEGYKLPNPPVGFC